MSKIDFLDEIFNKKISDRVSQGIEKIEKIYKVELPVQVKNIIKFNESQFYNYNEDSYRVLGIREILTASNELKVDFVQEELLPLLDTMDNDFICYDFQQEKFCLFNVVEGVKFLSVESIEEIIDKISK